MKKVILLCLIVAVYSNWTRLTGGYSDTNEVVLYATDWCGYCKKARQFFNDNNIKFQEFDIEKSDEGRRRYEALNGNGVPLILVNGNRVNGFNKPKVIDFLD